MRKTQTALVLEELTHMRDRITVRKPQRSKQHNWSFRQLREFLIYKAQRAGIPLLFVDPRNSSRTCHRCGYVDKRNRKAKPKSPASDADTTATLIPPPPGIWRLRACQCP